MNNNCQHEWEKEIIEGNVTIRCVKCYVSKDEFMEFTENPNVRAALDKKGVINEMKEDQRKVLTEFLDELWEAPHIGWLYGEAEEIDNNRTFDTDKDGGDLARQMVEKGVWDRFWNVAGMIHKEETGTLFYNELVAQLHCYPAHFCQVVYDSGVWK
jgi:hypothetical protein